MRAEPFISRILDDEGLTDGLADPEATTANALAMLVKASSCFLLFRSRKTPCLAISSVMTPKSRAEAKVLASISSSL